MRRTTIALAAVTALSLQALHTPTPATGTPGPLEDPAHVHAATLLADRSVPPNLGGSGSELGATHFSAALLLPAEVLDTRAELAATDALAVRAQHAAKATRKSAPRKTRSTPASTRTESAKTKSTPKKTKRRTSSVKPSGRASGIVIRFALAQVGKPYIWGADGPAGYDCSGLTSAAWRRAGVHLPPQSGAQARRGMRVSRSAARPGDLVVWSGHVAVYAGDGLVIHAPGRGRRIQVSPIWGSPTFRRVG